MGNREQTDYHVHFIELTPTEMDEWSELTRQIGTQAWRLRSGEETSYLEVFKEPYSIR